MTNDASSPTDPCAGADRHLLDADGVVALLRGRSLLPPQAAVRVRALTGGVSSAVFLVEHGSQRLIVKQARARLAVADDWRAPPERAMVEADALALAGRVAPGTVPRVIARDAATNVLVLECAPPSWRDWRTVLLAGEVDAGVARQLGALLARWHGATANRAALPATLRGAAHFAALRVAPFYGTLAERRPALAPVVEGFAGELSAQRRCLVHGDFSPKNVLVGDDGLWLIDFEVAHFGNPTFDAAFLLCHLLLKSVHLPAQRPALDGCIAAFLAAYPPTAPGGATADPRSLFGHAGCLLLARVVGKSPASYLTADERVAVERLGTAILQRSPTSIDEVLALRNEVSR